MRKLQLQQNQLAVQTQSPEVREAVRVREEELEGEVLGLKRKCREAEELLREYGKARAVEAMAMEYAEVCVQAERVQRDIERLESGQR